jgi:hypothetical protein
MFKKVETVEEMNIFNSIFQSNFESQKYETTVFDGDANRFIFANENGEWCASLELVEYKGTSDIHETTIEDMFPFSENEKVKAAKGSKMFEIDKLSILPNSRGDGKVLEWILFILHEFGRVENSTYYLALINPLFIRALSMQFGIKIEKIGKTIKTDDYVVTPMLLDIKYHVENADWDKGNWKPVWRERDFENAKQKQR